MALYRCIGNGGGVTPTDITPSNASPASMLADGVYKATAAGYAIESYQSITPSAEGASFNEGIVKMSAGGYAYSSQPSAYTDYVNISGSASHGNRVSTFTVSNQNGKTLLLLLFDVRATSGSYTKMDGATCSGGTIQKISNLMENNSFTQGTFYKLVPSSNSCTITLPTEGYVQVFEAE